MLQLLRVHLTIVSAPCMPGLGSAAGRREKELAEFIDGAGLHLHSKEGAGDQGPCPLALPRMAREWHCPPRSLAAWKFQPAIPHHGLIIIINGSISEPEARRCLGRINKPWASSNMLLQSESAAEANQRRPVCFRSPPKPTSLVSPNVLP